MNVKKMFSRFASNSDLGSYMEGVENSGGAAACAYTLPAQGSDMLTLPYDEFVGRCPYQYTVGRCRLNLSNPR
jgi:hypothetical protein